MTISNVRPREELVDYLQWGYSRGRLFYSDKQRAFRHVVLIMGNETKYSDEELELLARVTMLVDQKYWSWRITPAGYYYPSNPITFDKQDGIWEAQHTSWRNGTTSLTLSRAVSWFYRCEYIIEAGWWVSTIEGDEHSNEHSEPQLVESVEEYSYVHTQAGAFRTKRIRFAAPTLVELQELITLDAVEQVRHKLMRD